ncbi:hypothetical protein J2S66_005427 [Saccharothrix longispora]|uniref:Uncharacterized protein n=1 Tax=Saccharothrix longispora TaxID=33920 RepID=A0ABU1Q3F6_9PSEU|nr:hypothetical protein [Saccharothrix longispora]MDR6597043.1 hypothetical protein [Saccharothrix longispora]
MAVSDAVRRSGSLLLRALTVSGLATAAWLVCAGSASADTADHPDEASKSLDTVNIALDRQVAGQLSGVLPTAGSLSPMPSASDLYPAVVDVPGHPVGQAPTVLVFEPATLTAQVLGGLEPTGANVPGASLAGVDLTDAVPVGHALSYGSQFGSASLGSVALGSAPLGSAPFEDGPFEDGPFGTEVLEGPESESGPEAEHDGFSGYTYAGRADNAMPARAYEAKVAAKAAAVAAATPAAPPAEPAATEEAATRHPAPPAVAWTTPFDQEPMTSPQVTTQVEVIWEAPEPNAPAPAPKHAPSGPTASSNSSTDSGGGHRGGVIAAFTTESTPYPLTASSAERRNDWRSPGSIPGLPSTSPD